MIVDKAGPATDFGVLDIWLEIDRDGDIGHLRSSLEQARPYLRLFRNRIEDRCDSHNGGIEVSDCERPMRLVSQTISLPTDFTHMDPLSSVS